MRCVEDEEDHDLPNSTAHVINTSREIRFSWFALAGWGVLCRGDVKRSIVFDVVGYDTAVARGDLLFFLFCFFLFFFFYLFSRVWTIENDCSKKIVRRWEQARVWWWWW